MIKSSETNTTRVLSRLPKLITGLAIIILIVSCISWVRLVRNNPDRVFYGAIENSLKTRSLTKSSESIGSKEITGLRVSPELIASTMTTRSGEDGTTVKAESINTKDADYARWVSIKTDQKNKKGETLNFDKILNVWGKSPVEQTNQVSQLQIALLSGVVLAGNLDVHARDSLIRVMREEKVYEFDKKNVKREVVNNRPVYSYEVKVKPVGFYKLLKRYGEITGIQPLKDIDPSNFEKMPEATYKIDVDLWGQHIIAVTDPSGMIENFSNYGALLNIKPPKDTIPLEELEAKLQSIGE